jgi:hypothetical protein
LALTDTASANLFGLQMARLSRAGDDGADRDFIAPDTAGLTAGIQGMTPRSEPTVLEVDPAADAPGAYPLTSLTYAAIRPLGLTSAARAEYAAFVDYAAGAGQVSGPRYGELPVGYAPLTEALRTQARNAATRIRELQPAAAAPLPASSNDVGGSGGSGGGFGSSSSRGAREDSTEPAPASAPPDAPATTDGPLELVSTPGIAVPPSRFALPVLGALTLLAALGALEVTKRPRRRTTPIDTPTQDGATT